MTSQRSTAPALAWRRVRRRPERAVADRRVLVTGCGRSGTTYTSILLGKCGLDVPHERRMGKDGISSWLFGVESSVVPWGPVPCDYRFEHVVHLVRDPLASLPSIATFKRSAWRYVSGHVSFEASDPLLVRAARYWLQWNRLVERRADVRLRIEELPEALEGLCGRIGGRVDMPAARQVPRDLNTRRCGRLLGSLDARLLRLGIVLDDPVRSVLLHGRPPSYDVLRWTDLWALAPSLTDEVLQKALAYGYRYPVA